MRMGMIDEIVRIRRTIAHDVFDYPALTEALSRYSKPRDKLTKLLGSGAVIRIKKGLYCFSEDFRKEPVSREYLANLIYGPSYVSLDYALSFYGLIPERVDVVTSVTMRRSRGFNTPFGMFYYRMLTDNRYTYGADLEQSGKVSFLIATPEKALFDKVWTDKRFHGVSISDYNSYLTEDLRIDLEALANLDLSRAQSIAINYESVKIDNLVQFIIRLRNSSHA
jgi:predicted transcriptional regulator of viral defense system